MFDRKKVHVSKPSSAFHPVLAHKHGKPPEFIKSLLRRQPKQHHFPQEPMDFGAWTNLSLSRKVNGKHFGEQPLLTKPAPEPDSYWVRFSRWTSILRRTRSMIKPKVLYLSSFLSFQDWSTNRGTFEGENQLTFLWFLQPVWMNDQCLPVYTNGKCGPSPANSW